MMKTEWAVVALCAFSFGVFAVDYTWTGAGAESDSSYASPFENPDNYSNGGGHPDTGDVIVIPANTDLEITTRAQLDWIARLARIKPVAETSRLVVTVPQGETWTNACPMTPVNLDAPGATAFVNGVMVKRGKAIFCCGQARNSSRRLQPLPSTISGRVSRYVKGRCICRRMCTTRTTILDT